MYEHNIPYLRFVFRRRLSLFAVGCSVVVVDVPDLLCVYRLFKKSSKSASLQKKKFFFLNYKNGSSFDLNK